jgi:hypothetical protein
MNKKDYKIAKNESYVKELSIPVKISSLSKSNKN